MGKDLQGEPTYGVGFNGVIEAIKRVARGEPLGVVSAYVPSDPNRPNQCKPVNFQAVEEAAAGEWVRRAPPPDPLLEELRNLNRNLERNNTLLGELHHLLVLQLHR